MGIEMEIRMEALRQGMSIKSLMAAIGSNPERFSRARKRERPFTVTELDRISSELHVPLSELMRRAEQREMG